MAAAVIPYGQAAVPESVERAIEERRTKQIIKTAAVEATTVVLQPWPEAPEPTAFLQRTVQLITKPTEVYRNVDNSMQYPPATYETRSLPDHPVILMEDTRESAKRQYASRGNSMPQTVVTNTYTGLTLAQAHKLRFAGLSQNGLSAKNAEEAGGESTLAMRMSGPGTVLNTSRNTFSPGDPISWGAPPVTQVRKVDERGVETVDTSKHPLTHIMDGTDADRGDMQTAVPTPFIVNPSTFVDRVMSMAQRLNRKASDVANLNGTSLKKYLYHGDMTALQKSLVHTFMAMKKYAECETDAQAELDIYWHQVTVLVDTLLPSRPPNPADIKDNVLVPVGDKDLGYCEVLASLSRAGPDNAKKSRQAALADYLNELSDQMKALGAKPNQNGDLRRHGEGKSFEVDVTRGPLSDQHKNTLVYTILRRAHALRAALQFVSVHGKCLEAHFLSLRSQIDAVVTAHSVPGGPLSFIIVKHA